MNDLFGGFLFANAVAGGLLTAVLCAALGVFVVLRRVELLGLALPQASAAGLALAFLLTAQTPWSASHGADHASFGHAIGFAGALAGTFIALAILSATRRSPLPAGNRIAAIYALASSFTILFVASNPGGDLEMMALLRGELLAIDDVDLAILAAAAVPTTVLFVWHRREILLASVDPDFLRTLGRDPARFDAILDLLLGVAISIGVMLAGPLVVFGFLVLPGLVALRLAGHLGAAFGIACATAAGASLAGFAVAYAVDLPAGPVQVAFAATPWALACAYRALRHRG